MAKRKTETEPTASAKRLYVTLIAISDRLEEVNLQLRQTQWRVIHGKMTSYKLRKLRRLSAERQELQDYIIEQLKEATNGKA